MPEAPEPVAPEAPWEATPPSAHEWLSFADPEEDRTWVVDVTFLLSSWRCLYGSGCQGVLTAPAAELAQGCCSYGAHFTGEEDAERVKAAASTLSAEQWQFRARGRRGGVVVSDAGGGFVTRMAEDACIFLNRPGFAGGPGCALHRAALDQGRRPLELKPDVCWQLPLRREDAVADDGHLTSTLRQWDRRHWGGGGAEFAWWCTEAAEAFGSPEPVYCHLRDELVELMGARAYAVVAAELDARRRRAFLPHPAVRRPRP